MVDEMNYNEIIEAIKSGKKVHWKVANYWVIIDSKNQVMISYLDQHWVGLSEDVFTKYYDPKDFYLSPF